MKKFWSVLLVVALCVAFVIPAVTAAEKKAEVTQAELAQLLVKVSGSFALPPCVAQRSAVLQDAHE